MGRGSPCPQRRIVIVDDDFASQALKVQWAGQETLSLSLALVHLQPERQAIRDGHRVPRLTREAELDRLKSHFISMVSHDCARR